MNSSVNCRIGHDRVWRKGELIVRKTAIFLFVCFFFVGCGKLNSEYGRYELKNVKLPIRTIVGANTTVELQDELIRVDTQTGKVWKLQHGTSNINGEICEFSLWDELGNTYRVNGKEINKER